MSLHPGYGLATMEPPTSLDGEAIRNQRVNVIKSLRELEANEVLTRTAWGQYTSSVHNGRVIVECLAEDQIPDDSKTETLAESSHLHALGQGAEMQGQ